MNKLFPGKGATILTVHETLRCSPAMAASLTMRLREMKGILALVEKADAAAAPKVRGPCKPRQAKADLRSEIARVRTEIAQIALRQTPWLMGAIFTSASLIVAAPRNFSAK